MEKWYCKDTHKPYFLLLKGKKVAILYRRNGIIDKDGENVEEFEMRIHASQNNMVSLTHETTSKNVTKRSSRYGNMRFGCFFRWKGKPPGYQEKYTIVPYHSGADDRVG